MRFRVLGPLEVWDDGVQLELGAGRQRVLLALLVLRRNELVSVDRIIDALWGEHPPATAQKLVQGYISQLRKTVGADALITHPWGYGLIAPPGGVDVDEFERLVDRARGEEPASAAETLREALELWRPLSNRSSGGGRSSSTRRDAGDSSTSWGSSRSRNCRSCSGRTKSWREFRWTESPAVSRLASAAFGLRSTRPRGGVSEVGTRVPFKAYRTTAGSPSAGRTASGLS